jgi:microcin C transport system permease protein
VLIFIGYAIPGYALGSLLLLYFSVRLDWFPMGGFVSFSFAEKDFLGKTLDLLQHSVLPLICYMVGAFALVTMLLKNHLMDNLAADYIRTAVAKGVSFRRAVTGHALRNSLIPIATTFGQNITLLVSGSFLIETIFDIDGFGLLGLTAILDRDYPVVMGVVLLSSLLLLIGNILSDFLVALVDPRIRFH